MSPNTKQGLSQVPHRRPVVKTLHALETRIQNKLQRKTQPSKLHLTVGNMKL